MQEAIAARLKGYPQRAHRQMHRARVLIPAKAAAVLHEDAQLAGPAVEAFYSRDADDMRAAAHMTHFASQVPPAAWLSRTHCLCQSPHVRTPRMGWWSPPASGEDACSTLTPVSCLCGCAGAGDGVCCGDPQPLHVCPAGAAGVPGPVSLQHPAGQVAAAQRSAARHEAHRWPRDALRKEPSLWGISCIQPG